MKKRLLPITVLLLTLFLLCSCRSVNEVAVYTRAPEDIAASLSSHVTASQFAVDTWQIVLPDVHAPEAEKAFLEAGYISVGATAVDGSRNPPKVFRADHTLVTLQQTDEGVRIVWDICDPSVAFLLFPNENTGKDSATMVQIGVERGGDVANPMIGMCYIYKLSDGSAVILDGGTLENADNLYAALKKLDIDKDENGRYRITAWIFSHGHQDHYGAFTAFADKYQEQTNLSYAMYAFPSDEATIEMIDPNIASFAEWISASYPQAVHITPHAGLQYHFDNLTLHMLCTPEMLPYIDYANDTSLIFALDCGGARVLHMGDAGNRAAEAAWSAYEKEAFRADALQIAHHGLTTAGTGDVNEWTYLRSVYEASEATIGLLPMGTRLSTDGRNGRYTVINQWANWDFQSSFVFDNRPSETNMFSDSQEDYERFVSEIASETSRYKTLCGYDGVNTVVNANGMITYIMSTETENMATVFRLSAQGMQTVENKRLLAWLQS